MAEFFIAFVVSLLLIGGLVVALIWGRAPTWRPDRRKVLELMRQVQSGDARRDEWEMFVGFPVLHDPELESIRRRCVDIHEGDDTHPPASDGLAPYLYDRAARKRLAEVQLELEQLIRDEPFFRRF
ncbi:hypothetical protein [Marinobacterium sediminicola]|uniref:DUF2489 domain-containing protein n=1 Tax=Marinobacterium sediminicola TaxID=518898 RepID=A0ABY1S342_9GAMM|nr:hypothetical protein [Marinobacterium sediminicola]ULG68870.1 hypothetical protein LN244_14415 [Marinobacterium sediminicola]SMR77520.1 hypothetical protein SAMN04487964_11411 [Marinobacterium sediminicola]